MPDAPKASAQGEVPSTLQNLSLDKSENPVGSTSTSIHKCAVCDTAAKLFCSACDPSLLPSTETEGKRWYCGKECQAKDWNNHKKQCKEVRVKVNVQSLQRAASILQTLFILFRKFTYGAPVLHAERKGDLLYVKSVYDLESCPPHPGCDHSDVNFDLAPDEYAMMLTIMTCDYVFMYFTELCAIFIQDTNLARNIREIGVKPRRGPRGWNTERIFGQLKQLDTSDEMQAHCFYQITLRDGAKWAMDLTSAQFGHHDNLVPWEIYTSERVDRFVSAHRFGHWRDEWQNKHAGNDSDIVNLDMLNPDSVVKAVDRCQFNISRVILVGVEVTLNTLNMSPGQLLRLSSKDQFDGAVKSIVCATQELMREETLKNAIRVAEARNKGKRPSN